MTLSSTTGLVCCPQSNEQPGDETTVKFLGAGDTPCVSLATSAANGEASLTLAFRVPGSGYSPTPLGKGAPGAAASLNASNDIVGHGLRQFASGSPFTEHRVNAVAVDCCHAMHAIGSSDGTGMSAAVNKSTHREDAASTEHVAICEVATICCCPLHMPGSERRLPRAVCRACGHMFALAGEPP